MLTEKFTVLELIDLALQVPEIGAVNFNILHTVLSSVVRGLGIAELRVPCHVQDETIAQAAITRARIEDQSRRKKGRRTSDEDLRLRVKTLRESADKKSATETDAAEGVDGISEKEDPREIEEVAREEDGSGAEREGCKEDIDVLRDALESTPDDMRESREDAEDLERRHEPDSSAERRRGTADVGELRDSARELMERGATAFAEQATVVTDALRILQEEELLEADPSKVMEEMWRATNVNRRMDAAEEGLRVLSSMLDDLSRAIRDVEERSERSFGRSGNLLAELSGYVERMDTLEEAGATLRRSVEDANEQRAVEISRLEDIQAELRNESEEAQSVLREVTSKQERLEEEVAFREDFEEMKEEITEEVYAKIEEVQELIHEMEESLVKREDFVEIVGRVQELEDKKVNREELGRLLDPGFVDTFLAKQANLRMELDDLKKTVAELEDGIEVLKRKVDEDIIRAMEEGFAQVKEELDAIHAKLGRLDPDEINDSFANLEEQLDRLMLELEAMKLGAEVFEKEAKVNFGKISNASDTIDKLEVKKADKTKMHELLEMKADLDLMTEKLDRSEFVSVVGDMGETLDRLAAAVKICEEEMSHGFSGVRHDLSLKMYTEDFICGTQPIRNRIKALVYELERVKHIALEHLFPDAPGTAKCFSCNRGAHLAGAMYSGDAPVQVPRESSTNAREVPLSSQASSSARQASGGVRFPPIDVSDLDGVPIPPPDHPRQQEPGRLPLLFANMYPQVGLPHEVRRRTTDERLAAFFAKKPVRPCDGEHTRTSPQQRGRRSGDRTTGENDRLPPNKRREVLLKGVDKGIYRGTG